MAAKNRAEETVKNSQGSDDNDNMTTTEYCQRLQQWMWRYYSGYVSWQSWVLMSAPLVPPPQFGCQAPGGSSTAACAATPADIAAWYNQTSSPASSRPAASASSSTAERGPANLNLYATEYTIPSPLRRFLAETVDFFILFCVKATIVLWIMHLSGMKDISKFMMQFIVEEIDENTSLEDLQKMMAVALAYRLLVCVYEIICIWGAGGATPGKFLMGLRVVTFMCIFIMPCSTVRALNKNFSIAFLFPIFIMLLFFQHNRTVYDVVAGTIVVQRRRAR
uniref:Family with sequence similarity 8 member A1a n=2 Tax=Cyprinus carpio TaxID=7962 RepID=A0A9J8C7F0_CYPCA